MKTIYLYGQISSKVFFMSLALKSVTACLICLGLNIFSGNSLLYSQTSVVKGVWLTNVASNALDSRDSIKEAVRVCQEYGINHIFVVVWNRARTMYPSLVMEREFGIPIIEKFSGRDPLKEVIEEAHASGIKVHAWFEFGFSCSYEDETGGIIIEKYPHWAAINNMGKLVSKNGFQWMNAFNPQVQEFISSLIKEVAINYNIDGIQGDDRLPAVPLESGYDLYTTNLYISEHDGALPPQDYKDSTWVNWRADLLTDYLGRLYREIKIIKPDLVVSMAPSIHPWAKAQYLQDWPEWMARGYVDILLPQVYRYNIESYRATLLEQIKYLKPGEKEIFFPGILLQVNDKNIPTDKFLREMILENRKNGIKGESFFFFEGLKKYPKEIFLEK